MTIAQLEIARASFFSTHHACAADVVAQRTRTVTQPTYPLLVARARRFTSLVTQLHMEVCGAVVSDEPMPAVFATCHGEIQTAETLIADLFASTVVSSARFALSVHNTAGGLYSVATSSTEPTTTMTGGNAVAAGWLEAALIALETGRPTLLSIADEPVPAVFRGPETTVGVGAAFVLAPSTNPVFELSIEPSRADSHMAPDTVVTLARLVQLVEGGAAATVSLGAIRQGHQLELRRRGDA